MKRRKMKDGLAHFGKFCGAGELQPYVKDK